MVAGIDLTPGSAGFIAITFVIGLLAGVVVKRIFKLVIGIVALVILLAVAGYVNLNPGDLSSRVENAFSSNTGTVSHTVSSIASVLPISSGIFLVGLALGLWKG